MNCGIFSYLAASLSSILPPPRYIFSSIVSATENGHGREN
jgi:hypothetical protein